MKKKFLGFVLAMVLVMAMVVPSAFATADTTFAEFETATLYNTAETHNDRTGYTGTGYVAYNAQGDTAILNGIYSNTSGYKNVTIKYSNGNSTAQHLTIYNYFGFVANQSFPVTANWNTWSTVTISVNFVQGVNFLQLTWAYPDSGDLSIDSITIS